MRPMHGKARTVHGADMRTHRYKRTVEWRDSLGFYEAMEYLVDESGNEVTAVRSHASPSFNECRDMVERWAREEART
jgi:hypothetical protein